MLEFIMLKYDHRKHLDWLFKHMASPYEQRMFIQNSVFNSFRDFDGWIQDMLKYSFHEFFMLETKQNEIIGFIYSYESDMKNAHCKITVYIAPQYRDIGIGAWAGLKFIDYLFMNYPYRNIYCDVYSYNIRSLENLKQCGMEEMGRIKEYRFYNGKYYDLVLFNISREYFDKNLKNLVSEKEDDTQ